MFAYRTLGGGGGGGGLSSASITRIVFPGCGIMGEVSGSGNWLKPLHGLGPGMAYI